MAQQQYDFYILNEENDNAVARNILQFLEQPANNQQLQGYYDERDGQLGQSIFSNARNAIEGSNFVLVLISSHAVSCGWWELKAHMALTHRLENPLRRNTVIPVYLPGLAQNQQPLELEVIEGVQYDNNPGAHFWTQLRNIFN